MHDAQPVQKGTVYASTCPSAGGYRVSQAQVHKIVSALSEAADDERVKGLIAYVGTSAAGAGLAVTQELRAAVQSFRWAHLV
jgi:hypothetical protein